MRFMTRGKKPKGRAAKATPARRRNQSAAQRTRRIDQDRLKRGLRFGAVAAMALMLVGKRHRLAFQPAWTCCGLGERENNERDGLNGSGGKGSLCHRSSGNRP